MGMFLAGIPETTSFYAVNRQCSSGLQAVMNIANAIKSRQIDLGVGGGVESMSLFAFEDSLKVDALSQDVFNHPKAQACLMPMGVTSENVAGQYNITR